MPFLSTTQLVLVLWLLTAAAPAATALLNGSLSAWMPVGMQWRIGGTERDSAVEEESASELRKEVRVAVRKFSRATAEVPAVQWEGVAPAASVLHTALQRHKPRLA